MKKSRLHKNYNDYVNMGGPMKSELRVNVHVNE